MKIADLPFIERPVLELLHFDHDREEVDRSYAGYGWARVPAIWLLDEAGNEECIEDALVVAIHADDNGEPRADDVDLLFELDGADPASVLASDFLRVWLPLLPPARSVVLAMCNWFGAELRYPEGARVPVYVATGDVESWIDDHKGGRLELFTDGSWARLIA